MPHTAAHILAAAPGLTYRQLDFWCTKGWLHPDGGYHTYGKGAKRLFDDTERRVATTMHRLVGAGLRPDTAARVARGHTHLAPGITILITPPGAVPDGAHWCTSRDGRIIDDRDPAGAAA